MQYNVEFDRVVFYVIQSQVRHECLALAAEQKASIANIVE